MWYDELQGIPATQGALEPRDDLPSSERSSDEARRIRAPSGGWEERKRDGGGRQDRWQWDGCYRAVRRIFRGGVKWASKQGTDSSPERRLGGNGSEAEVVVRNRGSGWAVIGQ